MLENVVGDFSRFVELRYVTSYDSKSNFIYGCSGEVCRKD